MLWRVLENQIPSESYLFGVTEFRYAATAYYTVLEYQAYNFA